MLRKLICFIFFIVSVAAIIAYTMTLDHWISRLGLSITFDELVESISSMSSGEALSLLSTLLYITFQVYGIPITILLISIVGLSLPAK